MSGSKLQKLSEHMTWRGAVLCASFGAGVLGAVACGSADLASSEAFGGARTDGGFVDNEGAAPNANNTGAGGGASGSDLADDPSVNGIIAVHASRNLPAFRLCFPTQGGYLPLPDDKLMPNSNVVGVDVGAAVHIGSFAQPDAGSIMMGSAATPSFDAGAGDAGEGGTTMNPPPPDDDTGGIYVIEEKLTRQFYENGTDAASWPSCNALVPVLKNAGYEGHGLYLVKSINAVDTSVLANQGVNVLTIEGCLPDPTLDETACGTGYDKSIGNLHYRIVPLSVPSAVEDAGGGVFSFQAMLLSSPLAQALGKGQTVSFSFGQLASPGTGKDLGQMLVFGAPAPSTPINVQFTAQGPSDYDSYGFTLGYGGDGGVSQSLATIQAQSSPNDLPQDFYVLPSNFVVLVVGDPSVAPGPGVGPGGSLHLLAVPVRDPSTIVTDDGGADGGAP